MTKNSIPISIVASPHQQPRFIHEGVEFRIATYPNAPELCWKVYAGADGRVVVYKPDCGQWEELRPTLKNNDYYFISIAKVPKGYNQPYVQQVVCTRISWTAANAHQRAKHLDDDASNNRPDNLRWGTKSLHFP